MSQEAQYSDGGDKSTNRISPEDVTTLYSNQTLHPGDSLGSLLTHMTARNTNRTSRITWARLEGGGGQEEKKGGGGREQLYTRHVKLLCSFLVLYYCVG